MSDFSADVIVVGGGSAGCAMAGRLSEQPELSVMLLEAGRSDRHPFTRIPAASTAAVQNPAFDWCMKAEPDPSINHRVDTWAAGKVLGGGSAINGMMFIRGHRRDYDRWAELGASGWDYASVLPFFKRMETNQAGGDDFRGGDGPLRVSENRAGHALTGDWIRAAVQAGIAPSPDLNGELAEGVGRVQVSQHKGWRHSSAAAYIHPNRRRRNLRVELHARVLRIVFDGRQAVGVEFERGGEIHRAIARKGVVISCGTVNSARILMVSGIGPASHLQDVGITPLIDLPGVGANLQDHVGSHLVNGVTSSTLNTQTRGFAGLKHALNFFLRGKGALTTSIGHAQAFVSTRPGSELLAPNIQLSFLPLAFGLDAQGRIRLLDEPAVSTMVALMRPKSRGEIRLRSSDLHASPIIRHQLLGESDDLEQLAEGFALARTIMAQADFAGHVRSEIAPGAALVDAGLRDYLRMAAIPMYHPVGTCRMGVDELSVVSPDLALHGIANLWVADASVMPSLPAGNTNASAIMIGDKGADHVLKSLNVGAAATHARPAV